MVGLRLTGRIRALPIPFRKWSIVETVRSGADVPEDLPRRGAVLVASGATRSWLAFDCPCREHHRIMLNLDPSRSPRWKVSDSSPLSLWPSVDDEDTTRKCHFFIRNGRVEWMKDSRTRKENR